MQTKLSPIIAGTMNWGIWDKKLNTIEMAHIIKVCVENKITTFDHADIYGNYTTEADFGKAFKQSLVDRNTIQLVSKCGIQHVNGRANKIKHYDPFWAYHVWNVNEDETIVYDNFDLVKRGIDEFGYQLKNPIENWKIKVIDGTHLKSKKHYLECFDVIDKVTKPYKGYDAIYIQNFGFRPDGYTQITWDMFNEDCDETEDYLLELENLQLI
jgi:hypothetical protein